MHNCLQERIILFLLSWVVVSLWMINFYSADLAFNDLSRISGDGLQQKAYELSTSQQDEIVHKVVNFFDSKIGAGKLNYDTSAYNGFQLYFDVEGASEIKYVESLMTFFLDEEFREVPYNTMVNIGNSVQKDEIFSLIKNIRIVTTEDVAVVVGPSKKVILGVFGFSWIHQEPDKSSKIILFILSFFFLSWLIGTFQILNIFFRKGFNLK